MQSKIVGVYPIAFGKTFETRNDFYICNKVLIKLCFMKYIYFFINNINPLPMMKYISSIDIMNMATNIFNIG